MSESTGTRPSVVVLGGGYGGIYAAKGLDQVADVTLVDPSEAFHHNVASLRALVQPEWLERIFFPYSQLLRHGRFLRDRAVAVDGRRITLASGEQLEPDYLVLATGSSYPFPHKSDEPETATARAKFRANHDELRGAGHVLLIGAGPAGLELSGEIKAAFPEKRVTLVDVNPDILSGPYEQELRDELRRQLDKLGVELVLGSPIHALPEVPPGVAAPVSITTEAGDTITADIWFRCYGVSLQTGYLRGSLAQARDEHGYLRVDEFLRVDGAERVYAIGDISNADRNMAGWAGAQGQLVAANLAAEITGEGERKAYEPGPIAIILPLGPEGGAGQFPTGVVGPEQAAAIKGRDMLLDKFGELFDVPAAA
ncbi:FAD-dependent oxidoreductase [Micromonospora sp. NPDC049559]|uniref:NAD(P)/FAD-dependent oxidoreductase n=1 Tax=Micromonospora sp. NPDC049559 TaxID=3155923 RepID=UPI00341BBEDB